MTFSGVPVELCAQRRVLRGDADRAGVQVALAHHDAAHGDQRHGGKTELLGAQQRSDGDVASGLQLAVSLYAHAAAPRQFVRPAGHEELRGHDHRD